MRLLQRILITIFMIIACFIATTTRAHAAYVVHEIEPGILEMKGITSDQSLVVESIHFDKKKHFVYIGVRESRPLSGLVNSLKKSSDEQVRYFYAASTDAKLKKGQKIKFIQYGIERRVLNAHGKVPFGKQHYFYPLVYFESHS
jgi:hypothetical protein